ncbi:hypothetical protein Cgig2_000564 [Carnegiea gigantea]|uniref:C3H1-type domain-containing protein n=1 Tax=Carnegiea gigantea TaxID=171969 RepID=A0A9Q1JL76_9CARY|nr:hypothetical protein Cgig2_000564 [Carnegiea gigantea]
MERGTTSSSSSCKGSVIESPSLSSSAERRSVISNIISQPRYSAIFFHSGGSPAIVSSVAVATGGSNTNTPTATTTAAAYSSLYRLMSEHRALLSQHAFSLLQLQRRFKEADTLRQENTNLRVVKHDLSNQLNLLLGAALHQTALSCGQWCGQTPPPCERFEGLSMNEKKTESGEGFSSESPTSVIQRNRVDGPNAEAGRVTLPKSISVRSNEFLKISQAQGMHSGPTATNSGPVHQGNRIRPPSPVSGPQRVQLRRGSRKDGPIELEVYNQGMYKTELCNKWQESGTCPYEDHCQFAHGMSELRPVIRHPRYKTEVCRMILAGDPCPYGHRCHFRHALTGQEKLMFPLRLD